MIRTQMETWEKTMLEWEKAMKNDGYGEEYEICRIGDFFLKDQGYGWLIRQQKELIDQLLKELQFVRCKHREIQTKLEQAYQGNISILKEAMRCIQKKNRYQRMIQEIKEGSSLAEAEKKAEEAEALLKAWEVEGNGKEGSEKGFL